MLIKEFKAKLNWPAPEQAPTPEKISPPNTLHLEEKKTEAKRVTEKPEAKLDTENVRTKPTESLYEINGDRIPENIV